MITAFISSAIPLGVPLLFGSTGEIITEKSGHLNLGIPGIMYAGGIGGVIGAFLYESACGNVIENMNPFWAIFIPLICSIACSVLMGLIYSFMTVTLRANQNVTGLAITTLGIGRARIKQQGKNRFAAVSGGFVTIAQGEVKLIAITFEFAENIDLERAKRARDNANSILSSTKDKKAIELAKIKLQRALSRIRVAELK